MLRQAGRITFKVDTATFLDKLFGVLARILGFGVLLGALAFMAAGSMGLL